MLNVFNRIVTILTLLAVIACGTLSAIGVFLPPNFRNQSAVAVAALLDAPARMGFGQQALLAALAALAVLVAFLVLVFELRPPENEGTVRVRTADGSDISIARNAILQRVQFAVDRLDDVVQVEPVISGKGDGLVVHLDVTTSPYVDVPMKTEEIRAVAREMVEKQMGLAVKKITVKIDHDKYRDIAPENIGI
jgi:hypothetical protein